MAEMRDDGRQLNLPKREEEVLKFWEENKVFEKTLAKTKRGKRFVFYEGPPTANGNPGIHHFESRAFKDLIPRYQTMRGYHVERKAGWDTHGLPVEIQVEKELGLKSKKDIERYGIAKFNAKCRESVWRYKAEWDGFTKRIGFWLDLGRPYITSEPSYIETLWWIIKSFWEKKLLYRDFKVVPWCPRCGTALSTHELGLGYATVKDRSVYVRFRIKAASRQWQNTSILSWTTTPWTLPGNVALAVNPKEEYVSVPDPEAKGRWVVLGHKTLDALIEKGVFPPEYRNRTMLDDIDVFWGKKIIGLEYEPLFSVPELQNEKSHRVYPADFVAMEEGTGVVHTAVMYGEDDYRLGAKIGLPKFHTVDETGHFINNLGEGLGGLFVKDPKTEDAIIGSLKQRGLLFAEEMYEHEYPFCWRCDTPLLYYARQAWWVKMSALRKELVAENKRINWVPEHLKHGRFGEFIREARDWAFSRERYWGTPLPAWQCEKCDAVRIIGSLKELDDLDPQPTTLILMRHGEALHNVNGLVNPSPANDGKNILTARGKDDALLAARRLKREGIQAIVASPSLRAQETAKIVAKALGIKRIETLPELTDINIGGFEGQPVDEFRASFSNFAARFTDGPRGAENLREVRARMIAAVFAIQKKHPGKRALVVTHGDPSWVLMAALEGLPEADYPSSPYLEPAEFRAIRLHNWPYNDTGELDLHRPYADEIRLRCRKCSGKMRRAPEVCDVWFDSGAMPFAQAHYPFAFAEGRKSKVKGKKLLFPADYICEAIDQTRGWFYTLLAVSTALGRGTSYRNVISLGHVLDKNGQKMSKSRGNVIEPLPMIAKYGTDAIRWYFYTVNAPGDPKRFDEKDILLRLRGALSTLWNSFVFFDTYVDKVKSPAFAEATAGKQKLKVKSANVLDRWVMARIDELTAAVTGRLDAYDIVGAARLLDYFIVEDFSNWYVRRSRRRFQRPESSAAREAASAVHGAVLLQLTELMAPFTPFLSEVIYQKLKPKLGLREESVHLRDWPASAKATASKPTAKLKAKSQKLKALLDGMAEVRRLAALALAERAKAGLRVRQPLTKLEVKSSRLKVPGLLTLLQDEVNVKTVVIDPRLADEVKLDTTITTELREEGLVRELVRNIQELRRDAGLKPGELVRVQISGAGNIAALIERWSPFIQREAGAARIEIGGKWSTAITRDVELDNGAIKLGIRRA
ncbi:MAG: class I tRNA ligase family protein [Candidatus Sungbacteria bacterium]|uniref:Isoleucine--tRNA ligase n=1 Tax=Candidatus Sungiibacteriota bacterium TaxID=2750080 RepID=A0A932YY18_9BACT|nr:class I tRNA ligase family protein [Candidatus Sungbacteria bacterium]